MREMGTPLTSSELLRPARSFFASHRLLPLSQCMMASLEVKVAQSSRGFRVGVGLGRESARAWHVRRASASTAHSVACAAGCDLALAVRTAQRSRPSPRQVVALRCASVEVGSVHVEVLVYEPGAAQPRCKHATAARGWLQVSSYTTLLLDYKTTMQVSSSGPGRARQGRA